ncbi:MAG: carbohydrate kinase family protein [Verrucomicrobia bacterium]|nr:carbohydrate kinase family protein [Verrucomicrobiota bacterium]
MRSGIIAGGNWLIDHVKVIDTWPAQDSLANILSRSLGNGGGPYNVLKDLARLGASFPLAGIGLLGDDADGRRILDDCRAHGIDPAQLHVTAERPTSYTDVMSVRDTGHRTYFHDRGTNALLAPEHFDFQRTNAKVFHFAYLLLLDTLDAAGADGRPRAAEVLRRARAAGLRTTLDCVSTDAPRQRAIVAPVLPEVDLLFINDYEAEAVTGIALGRGEHLDRAAVERAARALLALGVHEWALIHFPEGACASSKRGEVRWQGSVRLPTSAIAGTAGAGDAFAAGVLYGFHEDWPMARCLELGVCTAAASLRHPTTSDSVAPVDECLGLGRTHGFRG